jgi:transcriptional regulator with XRE-family HTH domain
MTRARLASLAGISPLAIYLLETGRTQNPQERTRNQLVAALDQEPPADAVAATEEAAEIEGVGRLTDFDPHDVDHLPQGPGVYVFYDVSQRPIYVGESQDMARRIATHRDRFWFRSPIVESGSFISIHDDALRRQVEQVLIRFLKSNAVINRQHVQR